MSASGNAFQLRETIYDLPSIPPKAILAPPRKLITCSGSSVVTPTNPLSAATTVVPSHSRQRHVGAPLVTMEHIPQEILHLIFGLACNDGGFTARSLSLVSKAIREKSHYTRFHSVTCHDVAQTLALARILGETPPHLRVVRHILVLNSYKDDPPLPTSVSRSLTGIASLDRYVWRQPARSLGHTTVITPLDKVVHSAVLEILTIVAPTLFTLSLYIDWNSWASLPLPSNFPVLSELSINHQFAGGCLHSSTFSPLVSCPSLRYLIITGFLRILDPLKVVERIKQFSPFVTHLCLPYDAKEMTVTFEILNEKMTPKHPSDASDNAVFPRTLVHILVHTIAPRLNLATLFTTRFGPRLMLVDRRWGRQHCNVKPHLKWEDAWIDGIGGGQGYWELPVADSS